MKLVFSVPRVAIITALFLGFTDPARAQTGKGATDLITRPKPLAGQRQSLSAGIDSSRESRHVMPLTASGRRACPVFTVVGDGSLPLIQHAVESITGTVKRWSGADLPVMDIKAGRRLPGGPGIVLATFAELRGSAPEVIRKSAEIARVKTADEHGFVIAPVDDKVYVVSRSPRGVFNGAIYLRDFLIDGPANGLVLRAEPMLREPALKGRPAYTLTIWGNEAEYTAADWRTIFEAFAREGIDRIYFWVSGHFPSAKFPQTYKCADGPWDSTVNSRIGTLADLRAIIRHAHDLGMKLYLGGGMGAWCGTGLITHQKPGTMKTGPGEAPGSLCPSHPESRAALKEYYLELFEALPEADGVFIELAEEWGACLCAECAKPVDNSGSKQFGISLLTLARTIADDIRRNHPHARFAFTVGYDEQAQNPAFYRMLRDLGDEHYEWMEARNRWAFPGPDGKDLPAAHFSRRVMKWKQWYNQPLETLVAEANRVARSDFHGLITSFEPGFASGSFYRTIPFPTDLLPYVLTGFACREMSWEPTLSLEALKQRVHTRFFGRDAAPALSEDFWALREIIRHSTDKKRPMPEDRIRELARISAAVEAAWPAANPKTREALSLMRTAIADTRKHAGLANDTP